MTQALTKVSLSDIEPINWMSQKPTGWFCLMMHDAITLKAVDGLPTGDKHDEASVNECAKRARFGSDKYLVVVVNHEGKATAIYQEGEKIA